jgi:hypothetical protein
MESDLNKPAFTDERILKFFNKQWVTSCHSGFASQIIELGELEIHVSFNIRKSPELVIYFRSKGNGTIGYFTYNLRIDPFFSELRVIGQGCFFLESFDSIESLMTRSAAIEKLMTYPDFKEWLLWNRP